jgi:hypothetical protein
LIISSSFNTSAVIAKCLSLEIWRGTFNCPIIYLPTMTDCDISIPIRRIRPMLVSTWGNTGQFRCQHTSRRQFKRIKENRLFYRTIPHVTTVSYVVKCG